MTFSVAEHTELDRLVEAENTNLSQLLTDAVFGRDRETLKELFAVRHRLAVVSLQLRDLVAAGAVEPAAVEGILARFKVLGDELYDAIERAKIRS